MRTINLLLFLLLCTGFYACSEGENNDLTDNTEKPNQPPVVDKESSKFVGYWKAENSSGSNYCDLTLFDDGTCSAPSNNANVLIDGIWNYEQKSQYLSISATKNTFYITLVDDKSFLGVDISNNRTVSYSKAEDYNLEVLLMGDWKSTEGDSLHLSYSGSIYGNKVPKLPTDTKKTKYEDITYSFYKLKDGTYEYKIRWEVQIWHGYPDNRWYNNTIDSQYKGTVTITNPYSPSKCKVTFTGVLDGTYKKVRNKKTN